MHSQSARDVYYRFTLHYKKENLVAERNLGDFFITLASWYNHLYLKAEIKALQAIEKEFIRSQVCLTNERGEHKKTR